MPPTLPSTAATEYMLLFRTLGWEENLSPQQMQDILDRTLGWFDRLHAEGRLKAAQPLFEEGKIVSGRGGAVVSDGPFAESKETIAGYLIVRGGTLADALAIAQTWPMLEAGANVEVRPVAPECPSFQRILARPLHDAA